MHIGDAARTARRKGVSPFGHLRPVVAVAAVYAVAAVVWIAAGDALPGGRWFAVHLFTLGILTNLVAALTHHFAETILHAPAGSNRTARFVLLNAGTLGVLVGLPAGMAPLVAAGATAASAAVFWLYLDLRKMRKQSLTGRFAFVVRGYERACGAFIHGALLGALLGVGVLSGAWYGGVRLAHLHVNILGWGGVTLLATVVFFGPTILRTRMEGGADAVAARWIGRGALGLTGATLALIATGVGGGWGTGARLLAAAGLAVYALAATLVCVPVLRAGRRAKPSPHGRMLISAMGWFVVTGWAAVLVAAAGAGRFYDALGLALLVGVLGQAIAASVAYLSPMIWPRGPERRADVRSALDRLPVVRPLVYNLGVVGIVGAAAAGAAAGAGGAVVLRLGWLAVAAAFATQVVLVVLPFARRPVAETVNAPDGGD